MCKPIRRRKSTLSNGCVRGTRQVATAFPHVTVELWAVDEHRIGLKPILHKVWCCDGQRPLAPVQHRYDWRYLVGFVHPASGRTVLHLATSVWDPALRGRTGGVCPPRGRWPHQADRTGPRVTPAGTVALSCACLTISICCSCRRTRPNSNQPSTGLPLTNIVLHIRHFATIDELEDTQAQRCVALQARPDLIRRATRFQWWPQRLRKRQGPRLK
jgi:hypothetical protein